MQQDVARTKPTYEIKIFTDGVLGEIFERYSGNPILSAKNWTYPCNTVFNPGATRLESGETLLLARVEDHRGLSHLTAARSKDGLTDWSIDPHPTLCPDLQNGKRDELWGVEDPRIVRLEELSTYAVTYTAYSHEGPEVGLIFTSDFRTFERIGYVRPPEDKNAALFPRRIDEQWALLHRPVSASRRRLANIWVSFSPDLRFWSEPHQVMRARPGGWWDSLRIGTACPPIETDEGWLLLYHGVRRTVAGAIYRLGVALLDLDDPRKVIRRGSSWVLGPEMAYERIGDVPNVVFPCGHVVEGDTLRIYYGAADTCIGAATGKVSDLLAWLAKQS